MGVFRLVWIWRLSNSNTKLILMKTTILTKNAVLVLLTLWITGATAYAQQPPELIYFRSEEAGKKINVDWSVAKNDRIQSFTLERASTDLHFIAIGTVEPEPQVGAVYRLADEQPLSEGAFYRLKIVDQAGQAQYSQVIGAMPTASVAQR